MSDKGFIALVSITSITSILLGLVAASSIQSLTFFDQVQRKEYRLTNYFNAYNCIDRAILNLAHNYFYSVETPEYESDIDCSILLIEKLGDKRIIYTRGDYKNAHVYRKAIIRLGIHDLVVEEVH